MASGRASRRSSISTPFAGGGEGGRGLEQQFVTDVDHACCRPLLRLERETYQPITAERLKELLEQVEEIEKSINRLKSPASFADRFHWLRCHLPFMRERLKIPIPRPRPDRRLHPLRERTPPACY